MRSQAKSDAIRDGCPTVSPCPAPPFPSLKIHSNSSQSSFCELTSQTSQSAWLGQWVSVYHEMKCGVTPFLVEAFE